MISGLVSIAGKLIHWINFWPGSYTENPLIPAVQISAATSVRHTNKGTHAAPLSGLATGDHQHEPARRNAAVPREIGPGEVAYLMTSPRVRVVVRATTRMMKMP